MARGGHSLRASLLDQCAQAELLAYEKHFLEFPVENFDDYAEMPFSMLAKVLGLRNVEASTVFNRVKTWYLRKKHVQQCAQLEKSCTTVRNSAFQARLR